MEARISIKEPNLTDYFSILAYQAAPSESGGADTTLNCETRKDLVNNRHMFPEYLASQYLLPAKSIYCHKKDRQVCLTQPKPVKYYLMMLKYESASQYPKP